MAHAFFTVLDHIFFLLLDGMPPLMWLQVHLHQ
jgi:hypothetical protein